MVPDMIMTAVGAAGEPDRDFGDSSVRDFKAVKHKPNAISVLIQAE